MKDAMRRTDVPESTTLTTAQLKTIFYKTSVDSATLSDADVTADLLKRACVQAKALRAAKVSLSELKARGVTVSDLREFGFSALHLAEVSTAAAAMCAFGADDVIDAFLLAPSDAICIAGRETSRLLGVTTEQLLRACAGAPEEAGEVLRACAGKLEGVNVETLVETGIRRKGLIDAGVGAPAIVAAGATAAQVATFGFGFRIIAPR